jgi:hypothetical protein
VGDVLARLGEPVVGQMTADRSDQRDPEHQARDQRDERPVAGVQLERDLALVQQPIHHQRDRKGPREPGGDHGERRQRGHGERPPLGREIWPQRAQRGAHVPTASR